MLMPPPQRKRKIRRIIKENREGGIISIKGINVKKIKIDR